MIALLKKELRTLLPLLLLGVFLVSGDFLTRPFSERLDEATYTSVASIEPGEGSFIGFIQLVLGVIVAYAAFPREHDERTIELLFALPLRRRTLFAGKALAGLLTLTAIAVIGQITNALLVLPNPASFESTQLSFGLAVRVALLHSVTAWVGYGHGLFMSVFRRFGVLPYVFLGYALAFLVELQPSLEPLDPLRLARTEYVGTTLEIPWGAIAGHLAFAGLAAGLAYVLWLSDLERVRNLMARTSLVATIGFGCATAFAAVVGIFVVGFLAVREYGDEGPPDPNAVPEAEGVTFLTADARSAHYAFVYPESFRADALRLVGRADPILESASSVLAVPSLPSITVDLAESSAHHEGIAAAERIRMGVVGSPSWRLAHVLAHESTHVLQHQESDLRLSDHGGTTRFFVEGSAEWVAFEVLTPDGSVLDDDERRNERELRTASRIVAAVSAERHHIRIEDLLDDARFRARWDTALAYPLGEVLAESVARGCSTSAGVPRGTAVGNVYRAFARPDAPQDAAGEVLFRDALGSFGCDYEAVVAAWDATLAEIATEHRAAIDSIPRMSGGVVGTEGGFLVVEATLDRPPLAEETYMIRVRANEATPDVEIRAVPGDVVAESTPRRIRFLVPPSGTPSGARFEILFSLDYDARAFPVSEAWQSAIAP